jgi:hypothetical protein
LAVSIALALAGCATTAESALPAGPASTAPAPSAAASAPTIASTASTDKETCVVFGDVLTITSNADAGLRDGRMATQEQQGWYRLASRVLDRVPTRGEGAVSDAIASLKHAVPAVAPGAMALSAFGSDDWNRGQQALFDACADVDVDVAIQMFTGG